MCKREDVCVEQAALEVVNALDNTSWRLFICDVLSRYFQGNIVNSFEEI